MSLKLTTKNASLLNDRHSRFVSSTWLELEDLNINIVDSDLRLRSRKKCLKHSQNLSYLVLIIGFSWFAYLYVN